MNQSVNRSEIKVKIEEVVDKIKAYYKGLDENGQPIDPVKTRDQYLFGNPEIECTGVVVSCWPSVEVIQHAFKEGANLIISHEALFWNHGDKIDWLEESNNQTFNEKKALLEENNIVVWRNHDYIHSGMPLEDGQYTDGIFYGTMKKVGWEKYLTNDVTDPFVFTIPKTEVREIAKEWNDKLELNGAKIIGDPSTEVTNVFIAPHILGGDNDLIEQIDRENIDLVIALELIDFTVTEYIHDSNLLGQSKAIMTLGHFNLEEPGMEYMLEYLPGILPGDIPVSFAKSGDMYSYVS